MLGRPSPEDAISSAQVWCLLVFTFSTGIIDALSWLGLDGVFTANMTGNVLIVGLGLGGVPEAKGVTALLSLAAFVLGAGAIGFVQRRTPSRWTNRTTVAFSIVTVILLLVAVYTLVAPPVTHTATANVVMAFAMGIQGGEAVRIGVPQVTTVAVSSAVAGIGLSLFLGLKGERGIHLVRRLLAVVLLALGAAAGALLINVSFGVGLVVAAVLAGAAVVVGHFSPPATSAAWAPPTD